MLRKLMKHEFRATGRIILPLSALIILLSICTSVIARGNFDSMGHIASVFGVLVMMAYGIFCFAIFVVLFALMVGRFNNNLLSDEGYVMMTLPVSTHKIIWSKVIVNLVWFCITTLVVIASAYIVAADASLFRDIADFVAFVWRADDNIFLLEMVVILILSGIVGTLQCYAAMSVGHSFAKHKKALSVMIYLGVLFVTQFLVAAFLPDIVVSMADFYEFNGRVAAIHSAMGLTALVTVIQGGIYYFITTYMLKNHLNLD